jgi:hypothetical protein
MTPTNTSVLAAKCPAAASLLKEARLVRRVFELRQCDRRLLAELYGRYNPVPDIRGFIERALAMFPKLCCGLAIIYLRHRLGGWGVACQGFYRTIPHTVLAADDLLIDITADQFGGPAVYVGPVLYPWTPYATRHRSIPSTSGGRPLSALRGRSCQPQDCQLATGDADEPASRPTRRRSPSRMV